jgi:O-antigen ligase|nr:O-antigen ligase family protein [Candidatus Krumholzibacteria bacterium]
MLDRLVQWLFGASLLTLPFCGVGLINLVTGRDLGFGLQPSWAFLALAAALQMVVEWRIQRRGQSAPAGAVFLGLTPRSRRLWKLTGLFLLPILISALGMALAPSGEAAQVVWFRWFKQLIQILIMLMFTVWCGLWIRGSSRWRWTLGALALGAVFQLIYSAGQGGHFFWTSPVFDTLEKVFTSNPAILAGSEQLYLGDAMRQVPRLRGTMCEPLYLGNYLLFVLPWLFMWRRKQGVAVLTWGLVLLLLATWSRGAWLAGMGAGLVFLAGRFWPGGHGAVFPDRRRLWPWLAGFGGILLLLAVGPEPYFDYPRQRLIQTFSSQDWSNLTRLYSMQAAWRAYLLSPLVGVGWGQFAFHFPLVVDPMGLQSQFSWPVVNNFPLQVLCEVGIIGLVALGTIWYKTMMSLWSLARPRVPLGAAPAWAAMISLLAVSVQLMTFSQYNLPHIWVAFGLALAVREDPGGAASLTGVSS